MNRKTFTKKKRREKRDNLEVLLKKIAVYRVKIPGGDVVKYLRANR
jgi:hypothetical protein